MKLPSGPAPERSRANTGGSIDSTSSLAPLLPPAAALATSPTAIEAPADFHSSTSPIVTREGIRLRKAIQFVLDRDLKGYQAGKFAGKGVGLLLVREKLHPEEIFEVRPKDGIFRCIICNNKLQKKVGKAKISDSADPLHSIDLDKDEPGNYDFIICGPACFVSAGHPCFPTERAKVSY